MLDFAIGSPFPVKTLAVICSEHTRYSAIYTLWDASFVLVKQHSELLDITMNHLVAKGRPDG